MREREGGREEFRVQACFILARVRKSERKREGEREREREGERERKRQWVREREKNREGGREREGCRICPKLLFLFFKGMTGALAPFSYLVDK